MTTKSNNEGITDPRDGAKTTPPGAPPGIARPSTDPPAQPSGQAKDAGDETAGRADEEPAGGMMDPRDATSTPALPRVLRPPEPDSPDG